MPSPFLVVNLLVEYLYCIPTPVSCGSRCNEHGQEVLYLCQDDYPDSIQMGSKEAENIGRCIQKVRICSANRSYVIYLAEIGSVKSNNLDCVCKLEIIVKNVDYESFYMAPCTVVTMSLLFNIVAVSFNSLQKICLVSLISDVKDRLV